MAWWGIAGRTTPSGPRSEELSRDALSPSPTRSLANVFVGEPGGRAKPDSVPRGGGGVALRSPDLKAATASGSREKETEAQRCKTAAKCPHHGSQDTVMCPERREGDVLLSLRCHSQGGDSDA